MINSNSVIENNFHFPKNYVFFHYKHKLFNDLLGWSLDDIDNLLNFFKKKNMNIMFSSETIISQANIILLIFIIKHKKKLMKKEFFF